MTNPADSFFGESSPSAKFDAIGTTVGGVITRIGDPMQQTDFSSGKPLTWDDGTPRMQLPVTVQTDLRDPSNPLDDGKRTLYVKGEMKKAIGAALRAAGAKMALGGTLTVTFSGEEPTAGFPKKLYTATYAPPAAGFFEEPAQPVAAAHVGPPPAAPQPAAPAAQPAPAGVPAGVDPQAWAAFQAMQAQAQQNAPAAPPLDATNAAYAAQMGFQAPQQ
jgi:hypothetical protein